MTRRGGLKMFPPGNGLFGVPRGRNYLLAIGNVISFRPGFGPQGLDRPAARPGAERFLGLVSPLTARLLRGPGPVFCFPGFGLLEVPRGRNYSQDLMRKRPLLRPGCLAFSVSPDLAFLGSPGVVITYLPSEI